MITFKRLFNNIYATSNRMSNLKEIESRKCFGGIQKIISHHSKTLGCDMKFAIYMPPGADSNNRVPVLYWLSGLTCTEENFIQKSGAQRYASEHNLSIVCPDTSPRNIEIPGQDDSYDFGSGAGFYLDATENPWQKHYKMFSYVTNELIEIIEMNFPVLSEKRSISGHSMGGHGALISSLKNPGLYRSVSALAPISNPINCPWGVKAFTGYLGKNESAWKSYDATELSKTYDGLPLELFIDQGSEDDFYKKKQLLPENLVKAAASNDRIQAVLKIREGYDHSYYFVASVIGEHIAYHAKFLKA